MVRFTNMSIKWPKIVLFGDSLVQRSFEPNDGLWGALIANRFQRVSDVITRGFSGYTSRSCRILLPRIFFPENISDVEAFVIFLGTNDASGKEDASAQHVPLEEYSENLQDMISYLKDIGLNKEKIILITPGPYCDEKFMKWCAEIGRTFPKKDNQLVSKYADACVSVAKQFDVEVINLYQEMMKDKDWPRYLIDGLHLTRYGSFLVYDLLLPLIEKRIDASKLLLPYWRDINHVHPKDATTELCNQKCTSFYFPVVPPDEDKIH